MIVWRNITTAKPGCAQKLFDLIVKTQKKNPWIGTVRVYKSKIGLHHQVIIEAEAENMAEFEKGQEQWESRMSEEEFKEGFKEGQDLQDTGGGIEFLTVTTILNE